MMDMTTLQRVKSRLQQSGTADDTNISALITGMTPVFETRENRLIEITSSYTTYHDVMEDGQERFHVKAYPISSITSITYDSDRLFTDSNDVLDSTDYTFDPDRGVIYIDGKTLYKGRRVLKIVHVGGMAASAAAFVTAYPSLAIAVEMQVAFMIQKLPNLNVQQASDPLTSARFEIERSLLPFVAETFDSFRNENYV